MTSSPTDKPSLFNRALATMTIISVFYLNMAEILQVSCMGLSLPRPYAAADLFHMFTLWSSYTEWNSGYEADAIAVGTKDENGEPQSVTIDVHEYLPSVHGDANRLLSIHEDIGADDDPDPASWPTRERDYARVVDVLQRCHNRAHPEMPIDQMQLYLVWWPSSRFGYFHQYDQRSRRLLYAKPSS